MRNYKDYYEAHGQGQTSDGVLTEKRKWETGKLAKVKKGGSFGPGGSFPNGTIFENATFYNTIKFGDGCVFVNCKFNYIGGSFSTFGDGCVLDNCSPLNGVNLPKSAVLKNSKVGIGINRALINNTLVVGKDWPSLTHTSSGATGTRIDSTNTVVTGQSGIKGYRSGSIPVTSKTENLPPVDHYE